jgi:hypothetical protein
VTFKNSGLIDSPAHPDNRPARFTSPPKRTSDDDNSKLSNLGRYGFMGAHAYGDLRPKWAAVTATQSRVTHTMHSLEMLHQMENPFAATGHGLAQTGRMRRGVEASQEAKMTIRAHWESTRTRQNGNTHQSQGETVRSASTQSTTFPHFDESLNAITRSYLHRCACVLSLVSVAYGCVESQSTIRRQ